MVFADPVAVMSTIVRLLDERGPTLSPPVVADLLLAAVRTDDSSRTVAVMQMLALSRVVHAWIESNVRGERQAARQRRLHEDLDLAVGAVVSAALDDFEQAALLDPLTGLLNRRALDHDLGPILAAARRHGECLTVVMIDVEGLKAINDLVGHAAGDDTLRDVASTLAATLRAGDKAYRIGGDEFVLVFPGLLPEDVEGVMNRTVVERGAFTWGCAWFGGQDAWVRGGSDPAVDNSRAHELLKLADQRMLEYRDRAPDDAGESWSGSTAITRSRSPGTAELADQISSASRAGVVVEQATGVIAQHFGLRVADASIALRAFARRRRQPIETIATALVDRTLDVGEMASHRPGSEPVGPDRRSLFEPAPDGYPET